MNLEAKQREMKARMARQRKRAKRKTKRTPNLPRGVYVAPIRRQRPTVDFAELQALLVAHLRSPRIRAGEFEKLLDLGIRHGLVLENIRPPQNEEETEPGLDVRVGESQVPLKEVLRLEREQRARITKERETQKQ